MTEMQIDFLKQAATDEGRTLTHARGEHMLVKALEGRGYITARGETRKATKAGREALAEIGH